MKLIIGLGNIGKEYESTRHNIGFMVIDRLAKDLSIDVDTNKFKSKIGEKNINGEKIILMKPSTYMNLSGEAVIEIVNFYKINIEDILVIHDDLDLPVGKLRLRTKGSAGGQNGIKNIIAHLKTQEFNRIRIGIGNNKLYNTADYVLSKFDSEEKSIIDESIAEASKAVQVYINKDFSIAMNRYNK